MAKDPGRGPEAGEPLKSPSPAVEPSDYKDKVGTFTALRIGNFRLLLTVHMFAVAAQWIQQLTVNWLVYNITGSGTILGALNMVGTFTSLGMIPVGGILIDRVNHRKLLLMAVGWMLAITLGLAFVLFTGHRQIYFLFIFAALAGVTLTVFINLRQVAVFDLVPRAVTPGAVPLLLTGGGIMRSFGPAIGGFLILWFGPSGNFFLQAGAYALIAVTIWQMRFPAHEVSTVRLSPLQNIREGIRYVAKERVTRTFMLMGFITPLLTVPIITILPPIYVVKVYHGGPEILGVLLAPVGIGGIFGGIFTAGLSRVERRGLIQVAALFLLALSLIAFGLSTKYWIALPLLALAGFFEAVFLTTNQTLLMLSIPAELRGRIISIVNLSGTFSFLGGLLAGIGSDLLGGPKPITIIMAGTAACVAVLVLIFSPTIRNYRLSQGIAAGTIKQTEKTAS
jgi:MFS family permease